jgi:hypothetical protein
MNRVIAVLTVVAAAALAGCGKATIIPKGAQKSVSDLVSRQTGFRPADVKCPSGIDAKAGVTFTCNFTGPEGRRYTAYMRVIDVHGARVNFYIQTRPTG